MSNLLEMHPRRYYSQPRDDLRRLVPKDVKRVLEIGCGSGVLGAALKAQGVEEVVGVELNEAAAEAARRRLDRVILGDVERLSLPFPPSYFDCLIYGDVLEHLVDPWSLARKHYPLLRPGGYALASLPNVRHITVLLNLLMGRWPYAPSSRIFDSSHLRFFTLRESKRLMIGAGYQLIHVSRTYSGSPWLSVALRVASLFIFRDFFTLDYLILAKKPSPVARPHPTT